MLKTLFPIAMVAILAAYPVYHFKTMDTVNAEITGKERVSHGSTSRFMIWAGNETFENTDTWLSWKHDSADVYGNAVVGQTCDLLVNKKRIKWLSMNRNIIEITNCVSQ